MILELHVQPGASRSAFAGKHVEFLAEHYRAPRRDVRILAGLKARQKRVLIDGT